MFLTGAEEVGDALGKGQRVRPQAVQCLEELSVVVEEAALAHRLHTSTHTVRLAVGEGEVDRGRRARVDGERAPPARLLLLVISAVFILLLVLLLLHRL